MAEMTLAKWISTTNLSKAYQDDAGKMHVTAIVSDNLADLENDAMSQKALTSMVEQFKKGVDLIDNHRSTFGFGRTVDANLVMDKSGSEPYWKIMVDIELDDSFPEARSLYKEVLEGKCQKQLSIGGSVPHTEKDALGVSFGKDGRMVRQVNKVDLDHLACTRKDMAANPRTGFLSAVMKSLDEVKAFDGLSPASVENTETDMDNDVEDDETEELTKSVAQGTQFLANIGRLVKDGGTEMARILKDITENEQVPGEENQFPLESLLAEDDGQMLEDDVEGDAGIVDTDVNEGMVTEGDAAVVPGSGSPLPDTAPVAGPAPMPAMAPEEDLGKGKEELNGMNDPLLGAQNDMGSEFSEGDDLSDDDLNIEAAKILAKAKHRRMLAKQKKNININTLLTEIQMLAQHSPLSKGFDPKSSSKYGVVLTKALGDVRYLLATEVLKGLNIPDAVRGMAKLIKEQGPFAPGGDFMNANDDKVSGQTDVASTNITGADKQPVYADSAEGPKGGSKEAAGVLSTAIADTAKLPQAGDLDEFGKSLKQMQGAIAELAKGLDAKLGAQQNMVVSLAKTVDSVVNAKGISKSRNAGRMDVVSNTEGGVYKGLFSNAIADATRRM